MSVSTSSSTRFTLRQLPLAAKLVLTVFLLAVGLGYSSAMVQLHMQHSERDGEPLPPSKNVVAIFAGKVWKEGKKDGEKEICRLEEILPEDRTGRVNSKSMTPALFGQDEGAYAEAMKKDPAKAAALVPLREGERKVLIAWANAAPDARERAYLDDRFDLPPELLKQPLTPNYKLDPKTVRIHSLLRDRCVRCHKPGGEKGDVALTTYEGIAEYLPAAVEVPEGGGWVDSGRQMSLEKLTQSTHAHLLSFAVLFTCTGLIFAFSGFPGIVRGILGPLVLVAQIADISCWWLARLPVSNGGPYFAMAIMVTGGIVGFGLLAQIILSLFSLYGPKGKIVILLVGLLALGVSGLVFVKVIKPYLDDEKINKKRQGNGKDAPPPVSDVPPMERVLTGTFKKGGPWNGKEGGMVRAFFDKDELAYEEKLKPEREGEHAAVLAWIKSAADARKKAYEDNRFELPTDLVGKPITPMMQLDSKFVKVKTIINERCAVCHAPGKDKEEPRLDNFEGIAKILGPGDTAKKVDAAPPMPMNPPVADPKPNPSGSSKLELLVSGPFMPGKSLNDKPGGMVGAFFDKEQDFKDAFKKKSMDLPRLTQERENEQAAFLAWIKSPPDARKVTYDMDKFPLPPTLTGKPFTPMFKSDDKSVKVKTLIVNRCVTCHGDGGEKADLPLEEYDQLLEFLKPAK